MYEVTMPKLSDSMEVGKIIEWKVGEGDEVHEGDVLAEVESDKAVMELECFRDGTIEKIVHGDDTEVPVGELIAVIDTGEGAPPEEAEEEEPQEEEAPAQEPEEAPEGEPEEEEEEAPAEEPEEEEAEEEEKEEEAPESEEEERKEEERVAISPYARKLAEEKGVDYRQIEGSGPDGRIVARDIKEAAGGKTEAPPEKAEAPSGKVNAEPLAAALAVRYGLDLGDIEGSGADGKVTVDDVVAARGEAVSAERTPLPDEEMPALEVTEEEAEVEDASFRLKTQARRVIGSQHAIPHFYVTRAADVTELLERKDKLKEQYGVTVTHLIMLACIRALEEHPEINRSYDRGRVIKWKGINLGLAVETEQGLTVAVLRGADELSLEELVDETNALVERARSGKLSGEERQHPGFTITNLGMYDVEHFEPIINPPSSITLAVASALPAAVVKDGAVEVGRLMKLTAACDHRIIDGVAAAEFLQTVRALLEAPDDLLPKE